MGQGQWSRTAAGAAARRLAVLAAVAAETGGQPGQVVLAWMAVQRSPRVLWPRSAGAIGQPANDRTFRREVIAAQISNDLPTRAQA